MSLRNKLLCILLLVLCGIAASAQTLTLMPEPRPQFFDKTGLPLAGGKLYFWSAGTTTPLATYSDLAGTTPNANPIVLNAAGENPQGGIYFQAVAYKVALYNSSGVLQWSQDNVSSWNNLSGVNLVNATLTNPTINGGTLNNVDLLNAISVNESLTSPTITSPTVNNGTFNSPTINTPTLTGGSWGGSPTITAPTINGGTINNPTVNAGVFNNPVLIGEQSTNGVLNSPRILGGAIDDTPIGQTIAREGKFSEINLSTAAGLKVIGTDSNGKFIETNLNTAGLPTSLPATFTSFSIGPCNPGAGDGVGDGNLATCGGTATLPIAQPDTNYRVICTPVIGGGELPPGVNPWYLVASVSTGTKTTTTVQYGINVGKGDSNKYPYSVSADCILIHP